MKKFTKVSLIIAGIIAALGTALCIFCFVLGVSYDEVAAEASNSGLNINFGHGIEIGFGNRITLKDSMEESVELEKSLNLTIDVGGAKLTIEESDDGKFDVKARGINMKWNIEDDEIIVQTGRKYYAMFWGKGSIGEVTVYIPKDYKFKEVDIECGAGTINMDKIVADSIDLNLGAGEIIAKNINTNDLDIECGAGSVDISGSVTGNADIECSMGQVDLETEQEEDYYNYDIECSMGDINLNKDNYSGMGIEKYIDNNSDSEMNIECSMGEINIKTK